MIFSQLYGLELDRELGSADTTQLFTTARRKAAINAGQLAFNDRVECLTRQVSVTLTHATQEYDLDSIVSDYARLSQQGVSIKIVSGTNTRYIEGDHLIVTSVARLNVEEPGWRAVSAATPAQVYIRRDSGALKLGLHPMPSITAGDVWTALVDCVVVPTDLLDDADEPFTVGSNALQSLRPSHRALVHYAAYDLEKFRKETGRSGAQLQLYETVVEQYLSSLKPKQGGRVRFVRNYRSSRRETQRFDPRVWP